MSAVAGPELGYTDLRTELLAFMQGTAERSREFAELSEALPASSKIAFHGLDFGFLLHSAVETVDSAVREMDDLTLKVATGEDTETSTRIVSCTGFNRNEGIWHFRARTNKGLAVIGLSASDFRDKLLGTKPS